MTSIWKRVPRALMAASMVLTPELGLASSGMISNLLQQNHFLKLSNNILETAQMRELYAAFGSDAIWTQSGGLTALGEALPGLLKTADRHGLKSSDYWTPILESLYRNPAGPTAVSLELAATEALIRYATDLHAGRLMPNQIDDDIKFERKKLDLARLAEILKQSPSTLSINMDALAPQIPMYAQLRSALAKFKQYQSINGFPALSAPDRDLAPGSKHPMLVKLKQHLRLLGYEITNITEEYDSDLEMAIMFYQSDNGLPIGSKILAKGAFWRHVSVGMDQRIRQIELSMEKLRWLPNRLERRHVFTNLAFQRFRLFEGDKVALSMKTINGRPNRRTPSMRDRITTVEFNPNWTVPFSIALRDKIPEIQKDLNYLYRSRLTVVNSNTWQPMDPYSIDWWNLTARNMNFYLQQAPGPNNALGLMKFHLTNPWAIYYHDTNERNLFSESNRELSSGCIRLERPLELATYLLKDDPKWNSSSKIQSVLARSEFSQFTPQIKAGLKEAMPIYTLYLTAEVDPTTGGVGFTTDGYGQDERLERMLNSRPMRAAGAGASSGNGELLVGGTPGKGQAYAKVTAIRCDKARRWACDEPLIFDLNKPATVPAGNYLVAFENSLHAGWVQVSAGRSTRLDLVQVSLPEGVRDNENVRVFRDLSNSVEQRKFLWSIFFVGRHPLALANYDLGDLYPAVSNKRDVMARISAQYCVEAGNLSKLTDSGRSTCRTLVNARNFQQLAGNYEFKTDSTVIENFVTAPGDWVRVQHRRHLVSLPISGQDFISVFPGAYRAIGEGQKNSSAFTAGRVDEKY